MRYDVTNKTQANRVLCDAHGKSVMIERDTTRAGIDLDDATVARLREDVKKYPEVSIVPSADAKEPVAEKPPLGLKKTSA